ncbi:unnamed protein product [Rotaria socialis]|uniref:Uncharacterized protein n=1 Tax=Rotaria socialis TaxID=392032 RepID=A0A820PQS5_9BILA|nr:unnamed protein product [Rotaria socialis]
MRQNAVVVTADHLRMIVYDLDTVKYDSIYDDRIRSTVNGIVTGALHHLQSHHYEKKNNRANKRPCVVIRKSPTSVNVLLITRFYHLDPTSEVVLPQLSIQPAPPIHGSRSLKHTLSQGSSYFNPEEKYNIVLKAITVSLEEEWPTPLPNYIDNDELSYIRDILFNIFMEERDQSMETSKIIRNDSEGTDTQVEQYGPYTAVDGYFTTILRAKVCRNIWRSNTGHIIMRVRSRNSRKP